MRLNRRSLPLSFALVYLITQITVLAGPIAPTPADADELATQTSPSTNANTKTQIGRKDAPVDGKDGRPHEGPWVETEAERLRKKGKDGPKKIPKPGTDGDDPRYPKSNDGVMDDRNRSGPKEGTRGTEGGISEKSREKPENVEVEKKPEAPKEAPSLPHSEEEKIKAVDDVKSKVLKEASESKDPIPDGGDEDEGEIGGLKV